jgi:anti-sigma B factor antagonist
VPLKLTRRAQGDADIITVTGDLDVYTAYELRVLGLDLTERERRWFVIDMDSCTFLDSTGLAVLVGLLARARARDGMVEIACTAEPIVKIFRITGLTKVFGVHDTTEHALAAIRDLQGAVDA